MIATRRGFIFGLTGAFCAPAVVKAANLMPVSAMAPMMTSDPDAIGTLLTSTDRFNYTLNFDRLEKVVSLGGGYEAGYWKKRSDAFWQRGFLDHIERTDPPEFMIRRGNWRRGLDEAKQKLTEQRANIIIPDGVPRDLKRGRGGWRNRSTLERAAFEARMVEVGEEIRRERAARFPTFYIGAP